MKRSLTTACIVAAAAGLTAGCGSSGHGAATQAPARPAGVTAPPATVVSDARAINLRSGDVPWLMGSSSYPEGPGEAERLLPAVAGCYGGVEASAELGGMTSPIYARSYERLGKHGIVLLKGADVEYVESAVYVMRSSALAAEDVAAAGGMSAPRCVQAGEAEDTEVARLDHEPLLDDARASRLTFPLPAVAGYGVHVVARRAAVLDSGHATPYFEDTLGFAVGPIEIVLKATGSPRAVSATRERNLLALLLARAQALQH